MAKPLGRTEPRLWTRPLRELTPETSLGYEVIEFARIVLGIALYPWQKWLLIHALELLEDGTYRFRRVIVLVGRQNGKTTLASVLATWWMFVDSGRNPERVPPVSFKIVGVAQNLDIAREPWSAVKQWSDPEPPTEEEAALAIPSLQAATAQVSDTNGKEFIVARSRAHYEIRAAKNVRGKPAARVLMDEMREQRDWVAWNAVSQTTKSFWNGMLFGFSNAGAGDAVVLRQQRDAGLADIADWDTYVAAGITSAEEYANTHDTSLALFEWSAPDGCELDDVDAILQANPSIGHGSMTVAICLADIRGMTDAGYRTEVLCQWVTADVDSYIDIRDWRDRQQPAKTVEQRIDRGSRIVWGIDMGHDRRTTWISQASLTLDGVPYTTVRASRAGWAWAVPYLAELAEKSGHREVALQGTGAPVVDFIGPLKDAGLIVHELPGPQFAIATGRFRDHVRDEQLVIVEQPAVDIAVEGGVVKSYAENLAWDRRGSLPVDISGLVAETVAVYALEVLAPPPPKYIPPPPPAAVLLTSGDVASGETNLATAAF